MATNREYLNTLSDEEMADIMTKLITDIQNSQSPFGYEHGIVEYLQAEHTTTADEDFEAIGFFLYKDSIPYIRYGEQQKYHKESNARVVNVCKERNQYMTAGCLAFDEHNAITEILEGADK